MAMTASEIVAVALAMDPVERAAYVRQACGSDRRLLEETDALLIAHTAVTATIAVGGSDVSFGTPIGPYKLIRQIGEGGMGVVYHAQQTHPLRRDVADAGNRIVTLYQEWGKPDQAADWRRTLVQPPT